MAEFFWHTVAERRCYCTGGTSNGESWNTPPGALARELSGYTEESCVTYNMQKLTRHVYCWTGDARLADYYERTFYNGILGVQHPVDGNKLYYLPLAGGYWKLFGTPLHDFWCCTGSMSESFAKLGDSIYFHDESGIYVNLFVPSELTWAERGVRLVLDTRFPEEDTLRLTVQAHRRRALQCTFACRTGRLAPRSHSTARCFPARCTPAVTSRSSAAGPGGMCSACTCRCGYTRLRCRTMRSLMAVMYGPLVLAARLGTAGLTAENLACRTHPAAQGSGVRGGARSASHRSWRARAIPRAGCGRWPRGRWSSSPPVRKAISRSFP